MPFYYKAQIALQGGGVVLCVNNYSLGPDDLVRYRTHHKIAWIDLSLSPDGIPAERMREMLAALPSTPPRRHERIGYLRITQVRPTHGQPGYEAYMSRCKAALDPLITPDEEDDSEFAGRKRLNEEEQRVLAIGPDEVEMNPWDLEVAMDYIAEICARLNVSFDKIFVPNDRLSTFNRVFVLSPFYGDKRVSFSDSWPGWLKRMYYLAALEQERVELDAEEETKQKQQEREEEESTVCSIL